MAHPVIATNGLSSGLPLYWRGTTTIQACPPSPSRRQIGPDGRASFWPEWEREGSVEEIVRDWRLALATIADLPDVQAEKIGY